MTPAVRLDVARFNTLALRQGWTKKNGDVSLAVAARAIGCQPSTLSRLIYSQRACGGDFIARVLTITGPRRFHDVFTVDHEDAAA